ncbi:MAG TPA: hypothetical protein VFJ68_01360, partial [Casimicrobiaceae bacterium]|nr:hypothetical protein [Casimicrobiaceae bacterium]
IRFPRSRLRRLGLAMGQWPDRSRVEKVALAVMGRSDESFAARHARYASLAYEGQPTQRSQQAHFADGRILFRL